MHSQALAASVGHQLSWENGRVHTTETRDTEVPAALPNVYQTGTRLGREGRRSFLRSAHVLLDIFFNLCEVLLSSKRE